MGRGEGTHLSSIPAELITSSSTATLSPKGGEGKNFQSPHFAVSLRTKGLLSKRRRKDCRSSFRAVFATSCLAMCALASLCRNIDARSRMI